MDGKWYALQVSIANYARGKQREEQRKILPELIQPLNKFSRRCDKGEINAGKNCEKVKDGDAILGKPLVNYKNLTQRYLGSLADPLISRQNSNKVFSSTSNESIHGAQVHLTKLAETPNFTKELSLLNKSTVIESSKTLTELGKCLLTPIKSGELVGEVAELKESMESSLRQGCTSRQNTHSHASIERSFALRLKKLKKKLVVDKEEVKNEHLADRGNDKTPIKLRFNPPIPHKGRNSGLHDAFTLFSSRKRLNLQALERGLSRFHKPPFRASEELSSSVAEDGLSEGIASAKAGHGEVRGRNSNLECKGSLQAFRISGAAKRQTNTFYESNKGGDRIERSGGVNTENEEESVLNISAVMRQVGVCKEDSVPLFPALQCNYKDTKMSVPDVIFLV